MALTAALCTAGCCYPFSLSYVGYPGITSDGSGGAIATYEISKGGDESEVYVRRIGADGSALWPNGDILISTDQKPESEQLEIVTDGLGEVIVYWVGQVTKLDAEGNILWQKEGKLSYSTITDGSGGVLSPYSIYSEEEKARSASVLRMDSDGNFPWGEKGVSMPFSGYMQTLRLISDGAGGAIVVQRNTNYQIFAQRINSEGDTLWRQEGVFVCANADDFEVASDGSGGVIITWMHVVYSEGASPSGPDLYAQRVDAEGNILWQPEGMPICVGAPAGSLVPAMPTQPRIVSDGEGGAIIIWKDHHRRPPEFCIYAQKIDSEGNIQWPKDGMQIWHLKTNQSPWYKMVSDSSGGAVIVVWCDPAEIAGERGLLQALRLHSTGNNIWGDNGVLVS
ncbi:MAG: hypothetical protein COS88_06485, partial [Chloroflexi bacterium CG07_land_8_20_14_0_80_51_10]